MKILLVFFVLLFGGIFAFYTALQNGKLIHYLDTHPHPTRVPAAAFYIGQGYYIWGDLENSATYYIRIAERYPKSKYADDAYFNYLQAIDDMNTPRRTMAEAYKTYLERFPKGTHREVVENRIGYLQSR